MEASGERYMASPAAAALRATQDRWNLKVAVSSLCWQCCELEQSQRRNEVIGFTVGCGDWVAQTHFGVQLHNRDTLDGTEWGGGVAVAVTPWGEMGHQGSGGLG